MPKENILKSASKTTGPKSFKNRKNHIQKQEIVLDDIHKKIISSAALNGGFDALMFKIEKIEQNQEQLVHKVDKIHDAIYDPKDGIFSKINEANLETTNKINETDQKLIEVAEWKKQKVKEDTKIELYAEATTEKILGLEKNVYDLVKSKNTLSGAFRWLLVAIVGGSLTLLFKWLETKL